MSKENGPDVIVSCEVCGSVAHVDDCSGWVGNGPYMVHRTCKNQHSTLHKAIDVPNDTNHLSRRALGTLMGNWNSFGETSELVGALHNGVSIEEWVHREVYG